MAAGELREDPTTTGLRLRCPVQRLSHVDRVQEGEARDAGLPQRHTMLEISHLGLAQKQVPTFKAVFCRIFGLTECAGLSVYIEQARICRSSEIYPPAGTKNW
jgi:hypothetical protein